MYPLIISTFLSAHGTRPHMMDALVTDVVITGESGEAEGAAAHEGNH